MVQAPLGLKTEGDKITKRFHYERNSSKLK